MALSVSSGNPFKYSVYFAFTFWARVGVSEFGSSGAFVTLYLRPRDVEIYPFLYSSSFVDVAIAGGGTDVTVVVVTSTVVMMLSRLESILLLLLLLVVQEYTSFVETAHTTKVNRYDDNLLNMNM